MEQARFEEDQKLFELQRKMAELEEGVVVFSVCDCGKWQEDIIQSGRKTGKNAQSMASTEMTKISWKILCRWRPAVFGSTFEAKDTGGLEFRSRFWNKRLRLWIHTSADFRQFSKSKQKQRFLKFITEFGWIRGHYSKLFDLWTRTSNAWYFPACRRLITSFFSSCKLRCMIVSLCRGFIQFCWMTLASTRSTYADSRSLPLNVDH